MLKRLLKNEKGLTLIELLAVVVILGIVAAIAIPAIGKIIEDSKEKAVISDALQVINAAKIAKAANPTETEFEGDGKIDDANDKKELDNYLDTRLKSEVTVTFRDDGEIQIEGHEVDNFLDDDDKPATEKILIQYLEGN